MSIGASCVRYGAGGNGVATVIGVPVCVCVVDVLVCAGIVAYDEGVSVSRRGGVVGVGVGGVAAGVAVAAAVATVTLAADSRFFFSPHEIIGPVFTRLADFCSNMCVRVVNRLYYIP